MYKEANGPAFATTRSDMTNKRAVMQHYGCPDKSINNSNKKK